MEKYHFHFFNDKAPNFNCKLAHTDGKIMTILTNGSENFTIESHLDGSTSKKSLMQIKDLTVLQIQAKTENENGFYLIASKPYDQHLTILNSEVKEFKLEIKRNMLPDIVNVQDWNVYE